MKADHLFHHRDRFELESGSHLPGFQLKYTTYGALNADRSNVVWVCHALTGNSDAPDWWEGLFAAGGAFDAARYFIVCANAIGGCYGSTGPLSINPDTGKTWYHTFPALTNRDVVLAFDLLREHLGFSRIHSLIGGSLGGQQVLEWAILRPAIFKNVIPVACNAVHSAWGIAFNETQRMAIELDPGWNEDSPRAGVEGMKVARAIAMLSYRTHAIYTEQQSEETNDLTSGFRAASYQRYQGQKLANRFNAFSYHILSRMMDRQNVGRGRPSVEAALGSIRARTLVVGIDQDILFPVTEQKFLAAHIPGAGFSELTTAYGHDGFLVEFEQLNKVIIEFLAGEPVHKPGVATVS
ncbi:MAG: homoserine O-acetyltransferase [Bacteroidota bacterium]